MNLNSLPDDILSIINNNLSKYNSRKLNTTIKMPLHIGNEIKSIVKKSAYRVNLQMLLIVNIRKHFKTLHDYIKSYFLYSDRLGNFRRYNDTCLYYAPFVQYGMCRFCSGLRHQHKYYKMIDIYNELMYIF